jgi:uncharacterized membrane protein HdeD (DUF308 family)
MNENIIFGMIYTLPIILLFALNTIWEFWRGKENIAGSNRLLSRTAVFLAIAIALFLSAAWAVDECFAGVHRDNVFMWIFCGIGVVTLPLSPVLVGAPICMIVGILLGRGIWAFVERMR